MVKHILFLKRKPGLSREEFSRYWRDVHGPLVMGMPEINRHFLSYVQNHLATGSDHPRAVSDGDEAFDGIAEITFAQPEDRVAMTREPVYRERVVPDEERFIDRERVVAYLVDEVRMKWEQL
jgi:uncharacterized protein (TIGR02118 family)